MQHFCFCIWTACCIH